MKDKKGFSLIEVIVAIAIIAIMAGAIVPVVFNRLDQARYTRMVQDMQAIYEAAMGVPAEDYFGFVGDMGRLPNPPSELIDGSGLGGTTWNGPYLSLGGDMGLQDVYGSDYVLDTVPIQVRGFGPNRVDDLGAGDDLFYPENALTTYRGNLEMQVFINGRLITDADTEDVTASLSYINNGTPISTNLSFSTSDFNFTIDSIHQGSHVVTVMATKISLGGQDGPTTHKEQAVILAGSTTRLTVSFEDADYMTRLDTDLNGNGIPDRLEDQDGDGIPDNMDPDIDGDGVRNEIDADSLDPKVGGGGGGPVAPVVTAVSPSSGNQEDTGLSLTIDGSNFQDSATVTFSGTGITVLTVPATFHSASQLEISVDIDLAASTGWRNVTVDNPDGQWGTGLNKFQVLAAGQDPAPIITAVIPNQVQQGETNRQIVIQGQNFGNPPTVTFSNGGITRNSTTYVNPSQVQVNITVSGSAPTGAGTIRLTNPDAQMDEATFSVVAIAPDISQLNPNNGNSNKQNLTVTITGSGFLNGINATTSGSPLTIDKVNWISSTQMTVRVDCGYSAYGDDRQIILTNPGGGSDQATFHINGVFE